MSSGKRILIIGVGNPLRGDDGIGAFICQRLGEEITAVATDTVHQLTPEMAAEWTGYDYILLVDAASTDELSLYRVEDADAGSVNRSHRVSPELLAGLSAKLYQNSAEVWICAVPARQFEMGEGLSPEAKERASAALQLIISWIRTRTRV